MTKYTVILHDDEDHSTTPVQVTALDPAQAAQRALLQYVLGDVNLADDPLVRLETADHLICCVQPVACYLGHREDLLPNGKALNRVIASALRVVDNAVAVEQRRQQKAAKPARLVHSRDGKTKQTLTPAGKLTGPRIVTAKAPKYPRGARSGGSPYKGPRILISTTR
jgi:hypothetical protein